MPVGFTPNLGCNPPQSLTNAVLQPIASRVLGVPRGDPKKTDVSVTQEQLETLDKFKGGP